MKKIITLLAIGIAFFNNAQSQFTVGAGAGAFDFGAEGSESMVGFNISGGYSLSETMTVGLNIGNYWKSYDFLGTTLTTFARPITASIKYDFMEDAFRVFAGAELGITALGASVGDESDSESYTTVGGVGGLKYLINENIHIFGETRYLLIMADNDTEGAVVFNIGLNYKF